MTFGSDPYARLLDTRDPSKYDGLELRIHNWKVTPLDVDHVFSSFFEHQTQFPAGTVEFDDALLMRDIDREWHAHDSLYCSGIPELRLRDGDRSTDTEQ